jgi:hypothetical protein
VPASCAGGSQTTATCASGSCVTMTTSCGGYACDGTTKLCKIACAADTDCLTTFYCDSTGHCAAEKAKMDTCANADCFGGVACNECLTDQPCNQGSGKCP